MSDILPSNESANWLSRRLQKQLDKIAISDEIIWVDFLTAEHLIYRDRKFKIRLIEALDYGLITKEFVLMIYVFEVGIRPGYTAEAYADAWVCASEIIQLSPGARGTRLHRKIGDPNVLLAIASWESKMDRDAMEDAPSAAVRRIIEGEAEFVDIRVIGEFEDPEWIVNPGDDS